MAIDSKNLVVAAKVYSRGVALPLDASSVYESFSEAQTYAASPIAYAGQIITVLQDGAYKAYVLDGSAGAYTLTPLGSGSEEPVEVKNYVQIVTELPGEGQEQGVIYINTTDNKGYIYNGTDYQVVFENVESPDGESLSEQLAALETALEEKADLAGATFTGTVTLSADPTQNMEAVTKQYVDRLISGINSFEVGVVDSSTPLPAEGYKAGQAFRVAEAGTYAGQACELGDLIICIKDYAEGASDADFMVVQSNLSGVVIGPDASTDANIAVFDGITGKKIKDSAVTLASLQDAIAKAHEHTNKTILDSFTKNETELLSEVDSKISTATADFVTDTELTESLGDYVTNETYNTKMGQLDQSIQTINTNLNTKITSEQLEARIGNIGQETTIKDYVDTAVGAGGADVADEILQAKNEAIQTAKQYTDTALTITEFL